MENHERQRRVPMDRRLRAQYQGSGDPRQHDEEGEDQLGRRQRQGDIAHLRSSAHCERPLHQHEVRTPVAEAEHKPQSEDHAKAIHRCVGREKVQSLPGVEPVGRNALEQVANSAKVTDHQETERHDCRQHHGKVKKLAIDGRAHAAGPCVEEDDRRRH